MRVRLADMSHTATDKRRHTPSPQTSLLLLTTNPAHAQHYNTHAADRWMLPLRCGLSPLLPLRPASAALYRRTLASHHHPNHPSNSQEQQARLVLTHSTHLEGLLPTLRRVIEALPPPKLSTIVPARIAVCRGGSVDYLVYVCREVCVRFSSRSIDRSTLDWI